MTRTAPECRDARRGSFATQSRFGLLRTNLVCRLLWTSRRDDTPLSIPDEETPPSGNAGTGFWSILFQLLKHLAGKH